MVVVLRRYVLDVRISRYHTSTRDEQSRVGTDGRRSQCAEVSTPHSVAVAAADGYDVGAYSRTHLNIDKGTGEIAETEIFGSREERRASSTPFLYISPIPVQAARQPV